MSIRINYEELDMESDDSSGREEDNTEKKIADQLLAPLSNPSSHARYVEEVLEWYKAIQSWIYNLSRVIMRGFSNEAIPRATCIKFKN